MDDGFDMTQAFDFTEALPAGTKRKFELVRKNPCPQLSKEEEEEEEEEHEGGSHSSSIDTESKSDIKDEKAAVCSPTLSSNHFEENYLNKLQESPRSSTYDDDDACSMMILKQKETALTSSSKNGNMQMEASQQLLCLDALVTEKENNNTCISSRKGVHRPKKISKLRTQSEEEVEQTTPLASTEIPLSQESDSATNGAERNAKRMQVPSSSRRLMSSISPQVFPNTRLSSGGLLDHSSIDEDFLSLSAVGKQPTKLKEVVQVALRPKTGSLGLKTKSCEFALVHPTPLTEHHSSQAFSMPSDLSTDLEPPLSKKSRIEVLRIVGEKASQQDAYLRIVVFCWFEGYSQRNAVFSEANGFMVHEIVLIPRKTQNLCYESFSTSFTSIFVSKENGTVVILLGRSPKGVPLKKALPHLFAGKITTNEEGCKKGHFLHSIRSLCNWLEHASNDYKTGALYSSALYLITQQSECLGASAANDNEGHVMKAFITPPFANSLRSKKFIPDDVDRTRQLLSIVQTATSRLAQANLDFAFDLAGNLIDAMVPKQ